MRARPPPWGAGGGSGPKACGLGSGGRLQRPGCGTPDAPVGHGGPQQDPGQEPRGSGLGTVFLLCLLVGFPCGREGRPGPLSAACPPVPRVSGGPAAHAFPPRPSLPCVSRAPALSCPWSRTGGCGGSQRELDGSPPLSPPGLVGQGRGASSGGGRAPGAAFLGLAGVGGWSGGSAFPGALCSGGPWGPELTGRQPQGGQGLTRSVPVPRGPSEVWTPGGTWPSSSPGRASVRWGLQPLVAPGPRATSELAREGHLCLTQQSTLGVLWPQASGPLAVPVRSPGPRWAGPAVVSMGQVDRPVGVSVGQVAGCPGAEVP